MRWLVVLLALMLAGKALWSLSQALKRRQWEHWLTALGSACLAFALVTGAATWLAVIGLGLIIVGRLLREPAPAASDEGARRDAIAPRVETGVLETREELPRPPTPQVRRLRSPAPRQTINPFTKGLIVGEAFVPPDTTPSAELRVRASVPAFEVSTSNGGRLVASTPMLELTIRVTHLPDVEVGMLLVQSRLSDDAGRVWASESAVSAWGLTGPFTEDADLDGAESGGKIAFRFFVEADDTWRRAFDGGVLARGVASLHDGRDWTTLRIGTTDHAVYFYYQSPTLDVALLDSRTILVRVTELAESPDPDNRDETRPIEPFVYALPVERLLWFVHPKDHHARYEDGWARLAEVSAPKFRETNERGLPSPNVTYQA